LLLPSLPPNPPFPPNFFMTHVFSKISEPMLRTLLPPFPFKKLFPLILVPVSRRRLLSYELLFLCGFFFSSSSFPLCPFPRWVVLSSRLVHFCPLLPSSVPVSPSPFNDRPVGRFPSLFRFGLLTASSPSQIDPAFSVFLKLFLLFLFPLFPHIFPEPVSLPHTVTFFGQIIFLLLPLLMYWSLSTFPS